MTIPKRLATLARLLSPAGRRARLLIFCFHRVLARQDKLRPLEPDVQDFVRDIQIISRIFNVLPLPDAVDRWVAGKLPAAAACVTFDDGYADNHELAAPVLESENIPATFFIAAGAVDDGVMWNDLVIEAMIASGSKARLDVLPVAVDPKELDDDPSGAAANLLARLKYLPVHERMAIAEQFYTASTGTDVPRLMMTREQVADLSKRGFELGGHTVNHPILMELDDDRAEQEIAECRDWLANVTGQSPRCFAYPNGIPGRDFGPTHERLVRDAGFSVAVSTQWAAAQPGGGRFDIPRIGPWWRLGFGLATGLARVYGSSYLR